MQRLIIISIAVISAILIVFFSSFYFIDKGTRKVYYYQYLKNNRLIGYIKLEKFATEDKIIYISEKNLEAEPYQKKIYSKLTIDKHTHEFIDYSEEEAVLGATNLLYVQNKKGILNFLHLADSEFTYLPDIPIKDSPVFLKKDDLISYPEILQKHSLEKGIKFTLNTIYQFANAFPPIEKNITLSLQKHGIFRFNNSNIKSSYITLKANSQTIGSMWVYGWSNTILAVDIPDENIKLSLVKKPPEFSYKNISLKETGYKSKEISFNNGKLSLSGTLTIPENNKKNTALILVPDMGTMDRNAKGLFLTLADKLSKEGFAVLRFDKRGLGKSEGDYASCSLKDELVDLKSALDYIETLEGVDADKIGILGWGYGAYLGLKLASSDNRVKFLIALDGEAFNKASDANFEKIQNLLKNIPEIDDDYFNRIIESYKSTFAIARSGKEKQSLLGKKVYLERTRENLEDNFAENIESLKIPVLLLQSKSENPIYVDESKMLLDSLKKSGNLSVELISLNNLDSNFGNFVFDGIHRPYISIDEDVIKILRDWLGKIMIQNEMPPAIK